MKLLNWLPCVRPPQVEDAESPECYVVQAADPARKHNTIKRASLSSCIKHRYSSDLTLTRERAAGNSSLYSSAVGYAGLQSSRCPLLACAVFQIISPRMLSILKQLDDPMLATLMELGVDVPSNWRPTGDVCTAGHGGNNASGTRLCLCLASFCESEDSTKGLHLNTSGGELILALMELSLGLKNGIESQAKRMASRATTDHHWPAVGELEQCEHLVKGSHSFLVSSCYFRDRDTGSFQPAILVEMSSQHFEEHSHELSTLPHVITSASHHMSSQHVGRESNLTQKEEHSDLRPVTENPDDDDAHRFAKLPGYAEVCGDGPSIDGPYTERMPATPRPGLPFSMTSYSGLTSILDALPMMATMMDASGTIVLYKNKEAREYWDHVGRTQTATMEDEDSTTPVTAKLIMDLLFKDEVGTVCSSIANGQKWKGLLPVPRSPPSDSASLNAMVNLTIGSGRLFNSSDVLPIPPKIKSTCGTEASLESEIQVQNSPDSFPMPGETDNDEAMEICESDPANGTSQWPVPFSSPFLQPSIPPTISESFTTIFLGDDMQQGLSMEPHQSQPHQHGPIKASRSQSVKLPKLQNYDIMRRRRRSMLGASGLDEFSDCAALEPATSLADPNGLMDTQTFFGAQRVQEETGKQSSSPPFASSTEAFSDAGLGFRLSSRLLSIMHPTSEQQSIGSGDLSPSCRLYPVSQLAENSLRRRSLCFPTACRMDLMPMSADSHIIPENAEILLPLMMPGWRGLSAKSLKIGVKSTATQEVGDVASPAVQLGRRGLSTVSAKSETMSAKSTATQEVGDVASPAVQPGGRGLSAVSTKPLTMSAKSTATQEVGDVGSPAVQPGERGLSIVSTEIVVKSSGSTATNASIGDTLSPAGMITPSVFPTDDQPSSESTASLAACGGIIGARSSSVGGRALEDIGKGLSLSLSSETSTGFRLSNRLLSIMHPNFDRRSAGSGDSPVSSSRPSCTFSQPERSPRSAMSMKSFRSMTLSTEGNNFQEGGDLISTAVHPGRRRFSAVSTKSMTLTAKGGVIQEVGDTVPTTVHPVRRGLSNVSMRSMPLSENSGVIQEVGDIVPTPVQAGRRGPAAVSTEPVATSTGSKGVIQEVTPIDNIGSPAEQPGSMSHAFGKISLSFPAFDQPDFEAERKSQRDSAGDSPLTRFKSVGAASAGYNLPSAPSSLVCDVPSEAQMCCLQELHKQAEEVKEGEAWNSNSGGPACEDTDWHDVTVLPGMLLLQTDVSRRTEIEMRLSAVTEAQLDMLESMLPRHVLESVVNPHSSTYDLTQMARSHSNVTIMFMDIVGFTAMCKAVSPQAVMGYLNELFTWMDNLVDKYGIYKVDTCGDGYIVAGGLMKADEHGLNCLDEDADYEEAARQVIRFTEELMRSVPLLPYPHTMKPTAVRVGIHTGSCVSGLIGTKLCKFSLWGDTMNTASRMESTSKPGSVQISEATMALLESPQKEKFVPSGGVEVKGRGLMQTYLWDFDESPDIESAELSLAADCSLRRYHSQATLAHSQATPSCQSSDKRTSPHLQSTDNSANGASITDWLSDGTVNTLNGMDGVALSNDLRGSGMSGVDAPPRLLPIADDLKMGRSHPPGSFTRWLQAYQMSHQQHEKGKGKMRGSTNPLSNPLQAPLGTPYQPRISPLSNRLPTPYQPH
eukprot:gene10410-8358_t